MSVYIAEDHQMSAYLRVTNRLQPTLRIVPAPCLWAGLLSSS